MRECGLKFVLTERLTRMEIVTPYAGVWIEMQCPKYTAEDLVVTPYAGVWIEIS